MNGAPATAIVRAGDSPEVGELVAFLSYILWPFLLLASLVAAVPRLRWPRLARSWLPAPRAALTLPFSLVARTVERRLWPLAVGMVLLAPLLALTLAGLLGHLAPGGAGSRAGASLLAPSLSHPFGTDGTGRDLLSLVVGGAGSTYCVALVASAVALVSGVCLGLGTAYHRAEAVIMTAVEVVEALPVLVWALMVMSAYTFWTGAFEPDSTRRWLLESLRTPVSATVIGVSFAPRVIRLVRDQLKFFEREDFIVHARAHGVPMRRLLWYHVLYKNTLADLLLLGAALPGLAILTQINLDYFFSLSSFRVGVAATTSWTQLLLTGEARRALLFFKHGWTIVFPAGCLVATTLGCLLWGTGLRNARASRAFDAPPALARPSAAPAAPLASEASP